MFSSMSLKRMKKVFFLAIVGTLIASLFVGCGQSTQSGSNVIKIGLVGPWTGPCAEPGESMRRGAELAIKNINDNGGVKGYQLELVSYDDQSIPEESVNAVTKLISQDNVLAIVGAYNSSCTLADKEIINREKVPMITPISMADDVNKEDDFMFRNTLGNTEANATFDAMVDVENNEWVFTDGTGSQRVAILWENDDWGKGLSDQVLASAEKYGQKDRIVACEPYNLGTTDFYPQLTKILKEEPDLIYLVSLTTEAIQIVKQARELGYKGLFLGEGGFNTEEFDKTLGEMAYGCLFSTQWHPSFPYPMSQEFYKLYKEAYPDSEPDMFAAITYEAVYIVKDSIERAEATPDDLAAWRIAVRDAMAGLKDFDGVSGKISFNEVGQCDRPVFLLQKREGGPVIVLPKAYAQDTIKRDL